MWNKGIGNFQLKTSKWEGGGERWSRTRDIWSAVLRPKCYATTSPLRLEKNALLKGQPAGRRRKLWKQKPWWDVHRASDLVGSSSDEAADKRRIGMLLFYYFDKEKWFHASICCRTRFPFSTLWVTDVLIRYVTFTNSRAHYFFLSNATMCKY